MTVDYEIRTRVTNALIECRKEKDISQKELARAIDSKETTVASWEQGKSLPSVDMLYRLAKYYGKTMDYMYGEQPNEIPYLKEVPKPYMAASDIPALNNAFAAHKITKKSEKIIKARNKEA